MSAALPGEFEQDLISGGKGKHRGIKLGLSQTVPGPSQPLTLTADPGQKLPPRAGAPGRAQGPGPLHASCNLRCYLFFFGSFRSRAAHGSGHVSAWRRGTRAEGQGSEGKRKAEAAPRCVNERRSSSGNLASSGAKGDVGSQPLHTRGLGSRFRPLQNPSEAGGGQPRGLSYR